MGSKPKIITEHVGPTPIRFHDYTAVRDGCEPSDPLGMGDDKAEAIADLIEQENERSET